MRPPLNDYVRKTFVPCAMSCWRRWSNVTVETAEQLEHIAVLNARFEGELAAILRGPFARHQARVAGVLGTTAAALASWDVFTLARGLMR